MSALITASVVVSRLELVNVITSSTLITIPNKLVCIGLTDKDLATQLTASNKCSFSTRNFIVLYSPLFVFIKLVVVSKVVICG